VRKGEIIIAHIEQFLLFPQLFLKWFATTSKIPLLFGKGSSLMAVGILVGKREIARIEQTLLFLNNFYPATSIVSYLNIILIIVCSNLF